MGNPKGSRLKAAATNEPGTSKNLRREMKSVYSKQRNSSTASTSDDEMNQNRSRKASSARNKPNGREKMEETKRGKHQDGRGESSPGTRRDAPDSRKKEVSKRRNDIAAEKPGTSSGVAKKPKKTGRSQDEDSSVEVVLESPKARKEKRSKGKVEELVDESSKCKKGGASASSVKHGESQESSKAKRKVSNISNPRLTRQQARIEEQVQESWPFPVGIDENSTMEEKLAEMIRIVDLRKFPPVDLSKPPKCPENFNFIPNLENVTVPKERVRIVQDSVKGLLNCYFSFYGA